MNAFMPNILVVKGGQGDPGYLELSGGVHETKVRSCLKEKGTGSYEPLIGMKETRVVNVAHQ